jgi:molybdopterin synthase catalytic subunit
MNFQRRSKLTTDAIPLLREVDGSAAGALLEFFGVVRGTEDGRPISGIDYSCYQEMAEQTLEEIVLGGADQFPGNHGVLIVHRIGFVPAGVASLLIRVESPHSALALDALAYYLAEVKRLAPVWKEPQFIATDS